MKKILLLTLWLLLLQLSCSEIYSVKAQGMNYSWVKKAGGTSDDFGKEIAVDGAGNSYVTGAFAGTATFGNTTITAVGDYDVFVSKYDAAGNLLWVRKGGGLYGDVGTAIAIDAAGNCYVTGWFGLNYFGGSNSAVFGNITLNASGGTFGDIFVVKYDPNGNVLWAKRGGGTTHDFGNDIAVDASGNCYVTGEYSGPATFGSHTLTGSGSFVIKYSPSGSEVWARKGDGDGFGIALDAGGFIYATGRFSGTVTFGSTTLTSSGYENLFLVKYNPVGNVVWAKKDGGTSSNVGFGIAVDGTGNIYVTGEFYGNATFGNINVLNIGSYDMFLNKYDAFGNIIWAKNAGGLKDDEGSNVAVDNAGNSYVTGTFMDNAFFGNTFIASSGLHDIFIAKYDASGNLSWINRIGDTGIDGGNGIAVDGSGNCFFSGQFKGMATLGSTTLTSSGDYDILIGKLASGITGIGDQKPQAEITLFPNPSSPEWFQLQLTDNVKGKLTIILTDLFGKMVHQEVQVANKAGIIKIEPDVSLKPGLYLVQVQTGKGMLIRKLQVE